MAEDALQFLIDMQARLTGASASIAALDQIGSRMIAAGASAVQLDQMLASTRAELSAVSNSATAAAAAVAESSASYKAAEAGAAALAGAVERAAQKTEAARAAMQKATASGDDASASRAAARVMALASAEDGLRGRATEAAAALKAKAAALDSASAKLATATKAEKDLTIAIASLQKASAQQHAAEALAQKAAKGTGNLGKLSGALGQLGGPLGRAGQQAAGFADAMNDVVESVGTAGGPFAVAAVVVTALVAGLAAGAIVVAKWAVGLADSARSAALSNAALAQTSPALANIASILPQVHSATGLATEELKGLAVALAKAKVSAADMPAALRAAAMAEVAAKGSAAEFIQELQKGKKTVTEFANEVQSKYGGIVARQLLSLPSLANRASESFNNIFSGLKIERLLVGLGHLVGLIDESSASGRALKTVFEGVFQPIVDGVTAALPRVERLFLGFVIGTLQAAIALKPLGRLLKNVFGAESAVNAATIGKAVAYATAAFGVLAAVVGGVVAAALAAASLLMVPVVALVGAIGVAVWAVTHPIEAFKAIWDAMWSSVPAPVAAAGSAISGAISSAIASVMNLPAALQSAYNYITGLDFSTLGADLVNGFVNGILGGAGAVYDACASLATRAAKAIISNLKIGSPSKVMAELGGFTAEGMAVGVEDGSDDVQDAMTAMVEPPDLPGTSSARGSGGKGGGKAITISGNTFVFQGVKDMEDAEARIVKVITRVLEGDVDTLGGEALTPA